MTEPGWESTRAWRELLDGLSELDSTFLEGSRAVADEAGVADGYRMLATILSVAFDTYLFAEPTRPVFIEAVSPFRRDRRWGGDNTDAYYFYAPIDPNRTYRITGHRGDSAYLSLTVYNEPSPGAWSDRVVGVVNDESLQFDAAGDFELIIGPSRPEGWDGTFIQLTDDAAVAFTRDYQSDPINGRPARWRIDCADEPEPIVRSDLKTATALRSSLRWARTMFSIVPLRVGVRADDERLSLGHEVAEVANGFGDPYRVPDFNFGWSATDASYSFGSFDLDVDEALVVTHTPPTCRFWNFIVWNQFMAGHNVTDGRTSVNHASAMPNSDGSVTVVIARQALAHPNALTTMDHPKGSLAFRWFLADELAERPTVRLVKIGDAPRSTT
jgi:hypothetical protein